MRTKLLVTTILFSAMAAALPARAAGTLNLVCAADVKWCELMEREFEASHDIDVNMVRMSSGEAYARLRAEARNPKTDIWWAGTGDPHLQAADDNLTLEYKSPALDQLQPWAQKQAEVSGYKTVGVYSGALGWGYNTQILEKKELAAPACWKDLMGEDEAFSYQKSLNANVTQYTKSGSAPVKAAARGETGIGIVFMHDAVAMTKQGFPVKTVAPCEGTGFEVGSMSIVKGAKNLENAKIFYDWALSPEVQSKAAEADSFQLPSNKSATVPPEAPKLDDIKLIDYDFAKYGNAETRKALLERWDREIGASAN